MVRRIVAVIVVVILTVPVVANPADRDWSERSMPRFLKTMKRLVVKALGDGITVPRP